MKKILLMFVVALACSASASAVVDPNTYEPVNDIKIQNLWLLDREHAGDAFIGLGACHSRARTAVMSNGVVYVPRSEAKAIIIGSDTIAASVIYRFDAKTGEELPELDVTLDGSAYGKFLGVNSIGVDHFGHLWVAPYTSETAQVIPFYSLNGETGELTLITELDKGDVLARTDYYDVMGDITREQAPCNVINAASNAPTVYRWHCDQGGDTWEGGFEGDTYIDIIDFYPETVVQWGTGPYAKFILNPEDESTMYDGELYYIDGFHSMPAIYDISGSLIDDFEDVPADLWPYTGANGVAEFTLEGRNFLVYTKAQYDGLDDKTGFYRACQANICELGDGMSLGGMTKYWQIPADKLGDVSDGGNRIHIFNVEYATEDDAEVIYLFDFKCFNGMGVYKIGTKVGGEEPGPGLKGDVDGNGAVNVSDVTALVNMILGTLPKDEACADVDGNGTVNVSDVTALVNIILGVG